MSDRPEKTNNNLKLTLDLTDQLTWGELIKFVDLGKMAGYSGEDPVGIDYSDQDPSITDGLYVYLEPDNLPSAN